MVAEVERLKGLIDRDRTGLAASLNLVRRIAAGYFWIGAGEWGCYGSEERTEATLRDEVRRCLGEIEAVALDGLHASGDRALAAFRPETNPDRGGLRAAVLREVETFNTGLRDRIAGAFAQDDAARDAAVRERDAQLTPYLRHAPGCAITRGPASDRDGCSCGLDDIVSPAEERVAAAVLDADAACDATTAVAALDNVVALLERIEAGVVMPRSHLPGKGPAEPIAYLPSTWTFTDGTIVQGARAIVAAAHALGLAALRAARAGIPLPVAAGAVDVGPEPACRYCAAGVPRYSAVVAPGVASWVHRGYLPPEPAGGPWPAGEAPCEAPAKEKP